MSVINSSAHNSEIGLLLEDSKSSQVDWVAPTSCKVAEQEVKALGERLAAAEEVVKFGSQLNFRPVDQELRAHTLGVRIQHHQVKSPGGSNLWIEVDNNEAVSAQFVKPVRDGQYFGLMATCGTPGCYYHSQMQPVIRGEIVSRWLDRAPGQRTRKIKPTEEKQTPIGVWKIMTGFDSRTYSRKACRRGFRNIHSFVTIILHWLSR